MAKFTVNNYYQYVDTYEVEAETPEEAIAFVEEWELQSPTKRSAALNAKVEKTADNEYVDYDSTMVWDETGEIVFGD